jgi:hypothetical protein
MPITVLNQHFEPPERVTPSRLMDTIERNRDRIRVTANMIITLSGILISFTTTSVFFIARENAAHLSVFLFLAGAGAFLVSAILGISSTYLHFRYAVLDETQFVMDLMHRYHSEIRLLRLATGVLILGLLLLIVAVTAFATTLGG